MAGTRAKPDLRTVTIAIVRDGAEAQRMQGKLKSAGIESFLTSERSYAVKKSHDLREQHQSRLIRPLADAVPASKESAAVKVQVARPDVQRALGILGSVNLAGSSSSRTAVAGHKVRKLRPQLLKDRDPTVSIIVVIFILVAALILSLS
jgi:hypothetical protein